MVKHIIPDSFQEALMHLSEGTFTIVAGGTDIMLKYRNDADLPPRFVHDVLYLLNLNELKYVCVDQTGLRLGALTAYETLIDHPDVPKLFKKVFLDIAGPSLRYVATIAGNIANASPAADSVVPLYLYDAKVVLQSHSGTRTLPIEAVIIGAKKTLIDKTEMIREIIIPQQDFDWTTWVKVGTRKADAISKVSFCGAVKVNDGRIVDIRMALGSVHETVIRARDLETPLIGMTLAELKTAIKPLLEAYDSRIRPIDDQRSTKKYRKQVAKNLIEAFILDVVERG